MLVLTLFLILLASLIESIVSACRREAFPPRRVVAVSDELPF